MAALLLRNKSCPSFTSSIQARHLQNPNKLRLGVSSRQFQSAASNKGQAGTAHSPVQQFSHNIFDAPRKPLTRFNQPKLVRKAPTEPDIQPPTSSVQEIKSTIPPAPEIPVENVLTSMDPVTVPVYHRGSKFDRVPYWQDIPRWKEITEKQFLSYRWGVSLYHNLFRSIPRR